MKNTGQNKNSRLFKGLVMEITLIVVNVILVLFLVSLWSDARKAEQAQDGANDVMQAEFSSGSNGSIVRGSN